MMQVSKKIPFDDPQVLMAVRISYVVSNLIIFAVYFYVQMKINAKKGAQSENWGDNDIPLTSLRFQTSPLSNTLNQRRWAPVKTQSWSRPLFKNTITASYVGCTSRN